jgi:hypothetical protein
VGLVVAALIAVFSAALVALHHRAAFQPIAIRVGANHLN